MIYAGIGSRATPPEVLKLMEEIGYTLAKRGWTLRGGYAEGADMAFHIGACMGNGKQENYIPWKGFNGADPKNGTMIIASELPDWPTALSIAKEFHPAWDKCSQGVQKLLARNSFQIGGRDLETPVNCVICWTPDGAEVGGTAQAIRLAKHIGVPVFNLAIESDLEKLNDFIYDTDLQD